MAVKEKPNGRLVLRSRLPPVLITRIEIQVSEQVDGSRVLAQPREWIDPPWWKDHLHVYALRLQEGIETALADSAGRRRSPAQSVVLRFGQTVALVVGLTAVIWGDLARGGFGRALWFAGWWLFLPGTYALQVVRARILRCGSWEEWCLFGAGVCLAVPFTLVAVFA
jgi:hypothetical protein